ncbi:MAG: acyl-CoA/acyl-ACP dehydrogenase [Pseudomonas sp.]|uniref:acyl-CoA dehydrogenase family protein n=1 Tax=Pseudomonas sp. TaxID=306 RepID=UPI0026488D01|nr:acyl-CoA dehydrogenase family protein [Pseudomonas sp.]MDN5405796.1 acyl-CoA/acyl-ACP dehydrogenase [Pseudomonas sp.]MDN5454486.1 acyl-CoA/acyl-ACP dehydrogenase [Pseudomonas sp.]MDN5457518.1 acyl-CoA/acyl-ACP dehydrogenase [Pseudomonas sp.]MDN5671044.1 acyl-CoA/acyl-ACP dehydrogenase [Pseudomonas sp.]
MELALTDEQRMIQASAERFLNQVASSAEVRTAMTSDQGYDTATWARMARELYWPALAIPEAYGGLGLGFVEVSLLQEQLGRCLLPTPFFATCCLATPALLLSRNEALKERWLPLIAAGEIRASLAYTSAPRWDDSAVQVYAQSHAGGYRLNGEYHYVIDGSDCQLLIIAARTPGSVGEAGIRLFALPADTPGIVCQWQPTLDQTRRLATITLNDVVVHDDQLLSEPGQGWPMLRDVLQIACVGLAAEQTGGAQQSLDITLAYISGREQFGRTIASFQAIKHRCADLMLAIECARSASYYAACIAAECLNIDGDPGIREQLGEAAATAKIFASEGFFQCAAESIQLHGGVGFTWEYDPHLYFKRARASEQMLGTPAFHREQLARQIFGECT